VYKGINVVTDSKQGVKQMDNQANPKPEKMYKFTLTMRHNDHTETFTVIAPSWLEAKKDAVALWTEQKLPWSNRRYVSTVCEKQEPA
jgi:hypothetical protein